MQNLNQVNDKNQEMRKWSICKFEVGWTESSLNKSRNWSKFLPISLVISTYDPDIYDKLTQERLTADIPKTVSKYNSVH